MYAKPHWGNRCADFAEAVRGVADPVEREEGYVRGDRFLERLGDRVLSRIGGETTWARRKGDKGRQSALWANNRHPERTAIRGGVRDGLVDTA
jgi:hypothetical protein